MTDPTAAVTHDEFLAAFHTYKRAVEEAGGFVRDVKTDGRGLLTWSAGTRDGHPGVDQLEELYKKHLRDAELGYLQRLRSATSENDS